MNHVQQQLSICMLALGVTHSGAEEPPPEPARFENAAELAQLIAFPDTAKTGDIVIIRCGSSVTREGGISPVVYSNPAHAPVFKPYEDEARKVMGRLRVLPARVNNRAVPVWFNFSIIFDSSDGKKQVKIVPNLQYDVKRYGEEYVDPQRIAHRWFPAACARRPPVWTLSRTDADGTAQSAALISGSTAKSCERALIKLLLESKFIPAQHGGTAVAGTYVETWYTENPTDHRSAPKPNLVIERGP